MEKIVVVRFFFCWVYETTIEQNLSGKDVVASSRENLSLLHANNKGIDQPPYPRSLISAFVILYLENTEVKIDTCKGVRALRGYFGPL